jgi:hypothetical protein
MRAADRVRGREISEPEAPARGIRARSASEGDPSPKRQRGTVAQMPGRHAGEPPRRPGFAAASPGSARSAQKKPLRASCVSPPAVRGVPAYRTLQPELHKTKEDMSIRSGQRASKVRNARANAGRHWHFTYQAAHPRPQSYSGLSGWHAGMTHALIPNDLPVINRRIDALGPSRCWHPFLAAIQACSYRSYLSIAVDNLPTHDPASGLLPGDLPRHPPHTRMPSGRVYAPSAECPITGVVFRGKRLCPDHLAAASFRPPLGALSP